MVRIKSVVTVTMHYMVTPRRVIVTRVNVITTVPIRTVVVNSVVTS